MQITSVEKDKRNSCKLLVYIDEKYSFCISEEDYLRLNLYEKRDIAEEEVEYIKNELNFRSAKSTAVKYVSFRLRSERELWLKLENERYDNGIIEKVIEEIKSLGYINDKLYVQKYIYDRSKLKPRSKKLLKLELLNKGISEDDIDNVLKEWDMDEVAIAEGLARKKFGKYNIKDEKTVKKIYAFLTHRGFSYDIVRTTVNKLSKGHEL